MLRVRSNMPLWWFKPLWDLSPGGREEKRLINRMYSFTKSVIADRIKEFRSLPQEEMEQIKEEYNSGKVKRKLAFLDTLIYAMDVKKAGYQAELSLTPVDRRLKTTLSTFYQKVDESVPLG